MRSCAKTKFLSDITRLGSAKEVVFFGSTFIFFRLPPTPPSELKKAVRLVPTASLHERLRLEELVAGLTEANSQTAVNWAASAL